MYFLLLCHIIGTVKGCQLCQEKSEWGYKSQYNPNLTVLVNTFIYNSIPIAINRKCSCFLFFLTVNSTHELGPLVDLKIPANKTRWTLKNLNFSTRYKFYFNAQTSAGSGSQITEEGVTTVDEGKMGMYKIHKTVSVLKQKSLT